jgi:hypothetical protein
MMPLIEWRIISFDSGLMAKLSFASTPEDWKAGILDVVQLGISAENALRLAADLKDHAEKVLSGQKLHPTPQ